MGNDSSSLAANKGNISLNSISKSNGSNVLIKKSVGEYLEDGRISEFDLIKKIDEGLGLGSYKNNNYNILDVVIDRNMEKLALKLVKKFSNDLMPNKVTKGNSTLMLASLRGMDKLMKLMSNVYGSLCRPGYVNNTFNTTHNTTNNTALQYALIEGHIGAANVLLDKFKEKCNINNINNKGETAILLAICNRNETVLEKIINIYKYGIEYPKSVNKILSRAIIKKIDEDLIIKMINIFEDKLKFNTKIVIYGKQKSKIYTAPLSKAIKNNLTEIAKKIINSEICDPGYVLTDNYDRYSSTLKDSEKCTALQYAVYGDHLDIAHLLLDKFGKDCNINNNDKSGDTVLSLAIKKNYIDIVEKIIQLYETDKNIRNLVRNKDLQYAVSCGHLDIAHLLLDNWGKDIDLDIINKSDDTLLSLAIKKNYEEIIEKILKIYEDEQNYNGNPGKNILMLALTHKMEEDQIIRLIDVLGDKCDPEYVESKGKYSYNETKGQTVLMYAIQNNMDSLFRKMIERFGDKCNPEYVDPKKNQTVLIMAIDRKRENLAMELLNTFSFKCQLKVSDNYKMTAKTLAKFHEMKEVENKINDIIQKLEDKS